jgi:transcriptional regulator with XRE-family HTH domain
MILAHKIATLRKRLNWSQEELAEKLSVSRQSVSKWESANSIPDLSKIVSMAEIFNVTTDYLLKDDLEDIDTASAATQDGVRKLLSLEQALAYIDNKYKASIIVSKGVALCVCSVIPLFFLLAMAETGRWGMTDDLAAGLGILGIVIMVSLGVSLFIRSNQLEEDTEHLEHQPIELAYGVHGAIREKFKVFKPLYIRRLSIGIALFIASFTPIIIKELLFGHSSSTLLMIIVLMVLIAIGLSLVIPASAKYEAYTRVLNEQFKKSDKTKRAKRAEKLGAFYWPLVTAIFLGWSFWTMAWGITWIIWPVAALLFAALLGLIGLFQKEQD